MLGVLTFFHKVYPKRVFLSLLYFYCTFNVFGIINDSISSFSDFMSTSPLFLIPPNLLQSLCHSNLDFPLPFSPHQSIFIRTFKLIFLFTLPQLVCIENRMIIKVNLNVTITQFVQTVETFRPCLFNKIKIPPFFHNTFLNTG